jgi:uncharacterized membrane protein YccC
MAKTTDVSHIAAYLFVVGLIVAVIGGLYVGLGNVSASMQNWLSVVFIIIGVVIGALMVTSKKIEEEIYVILLVTVALLIASQMGVFAGLNEAYANLGTAINRVVSYIAMFSAAAIIVLAIRTITHFHVSKIR